MSLSLGLQMFAGIGILIYGMTIMGDSLQVIAGDRLRRLIGCLTGTPLKGLAVGTVVTGILQSSGATTVMVVSFVDVGFMTLTQAIGVILGANIGTTVTGQLIAFDITNVTYVCAFVGAGITFLSKNKKIKHIGVCILGFALLFIGMKMMQQPLGYFKERPDIFANFISHKWMAFLAGLVITAIVQSSSATVGLTMAVASQGILPLDTAIVIILGDNIGSTITAVLVSLAAKRSAKQAAAAHVMIKVIGTVIIFLILPVYTSLIQMTAETMSRQVANAHTIFNVIIALLFLPFVSQYAKLIRKIIPDDEKSQTTGVIYLKPALITASSAAAVDAVRKETIRLSRMAQKMIQQCRALLIEHKTEFVDEIMRFEDNVNEINHEIVRYTTEIGQTGLSTELSKVLNAFTSAVGDIERIGDHATNLVEMYQYLDTHKLVFSPTAIGEGKEMFDLVLLTLEKSVEALEQEDAALANEAMVLEDRIDFMEKMLRAQHISRLNTGGCSPGAGVIFIDILSNLERVGDHAENLAEVALQLANLHDDTSKNSK